MYNKSNTRKFDNWNKVKKKVNNKKGVFSFREKEIWWCHLGHNIGYETYGKSEFFTRPIIIFKKFSSNSFIGIPTSTKIKEGIWYQNFTFSGEKQTALISQIKFVDSKRLQRKLGELTKYDFNKVKSSFEKLFDFKNNHSPKGGDRRVNP